MPNNATQMRIKAQKIQRYMNNIAPRQARDLGLQFYKSRWQAQGWLDTTFKPWPKRKRKDKRRPGRGILMDRGKLRNSLRAQINGGNITFGSDVKYAKIHNEGGTIQRHARSERFVRNRYVRGKNKGAFKRGTSEGRGYSYKAHTITMPKRQFLGNSAHLNKIIARKMTLEITKIFYK